MNVSLDCYRAAIGTHNILYMSLPKKSDISPSLQHILLTLICGLLSILQLFIWHFEEALKSSVKCCCFLTLNSIYKMKNIALNSKNLYCFISWIHIFSLINIMLLLISGIERNPGPILPRFSFATWNLDSILAREGCKLSSIEGLDSVYKFDIFGIVESYLDSSISNSKIEIPCFAPDPIRSDCKDIGNRAKGGVCLYYKDHIPLKHRPELELLNECIVAEINIKNKKIIYILLYRSPNQNPQVFANFIKNLKTMLDKIGDENPFAIILTGDLNCRSPNFWDDEILESSEGKELSNLTLSNGLKQVINEPTHFPRDGIATCIDHIFTNQEHILCDNVVSTLWFMEK